MPIAARTRLLTWIVGSALLASLAGCSMVPQIQGSGIAMTEQRDVPEFTEVEVGNAVALELSVGRQASLEVMSDDNLLPHVITEVVGDRLKITMDANTSSKLGVRVKATTPVLNALSGSGATVSTLSGVEAKAFRLTLSGASRAKVDGHAEEMHVELSGASKCALEGSTDRLVVNCSGASNLAAAEMKARSVETDVSGASMADVSPAEELSATASGASKVIYSGSPKLKREMAASGASVISRK